jgi:hypothetical protein
MIQWLGMSSGHDGSTLKDGIPDGWPLTGDGDVSKTAPHTSSAA